ncbi:unnamed protein product [Darwinula stevensoni]|uniref:Uncharacterized protein n=1 Tax=Darwinula stevensoni TaxID=69355 RepID=A0A7R8X7L0_9CRUS|nr:unnamed protein product [Darwinula stevensoni]CAG0883436.1 unnamed protein product [Darwinula stevensoni]
MAAFRKNNYTERYHDRTLCSESQSEGKNSATRTMARGKEQSQDNRHRALPAIGAPRNEERPRNKSSNPKALVKRSIPMSSTSMIDATLTNPAARRHKSEEYSNYSEPKHRVTKWSECHGDSTDEQTQIIEKKAIHPWKITQPSHENSTQKSLRESMEPTMCKDPRLARRLPPPWEVTLIRLGRDEHDAFDTLETREDKTNTKAQNLYQAVEKNANKDEISPSPSIFFQKDVPKRSECESANSRATNCNAGRKSSPGVEPITDCHDAWQVYEPKSQTYHKICKFHDQLDANSPRKEKEAEHEPPRIPFGLGLVELEDQGRKEDSKAIRNPIDDGIGSEGCEDDDPTVSPVGDVGDFDRLLLVDGNGRRPEFFLSRTEDFPSSGSHAPGTSEGYTGFLRVGLEGKQSLPDEWQEKLGSFSLDAGKASSRAQSSI